MTQPTANDCRDYHVQVLLHLGCVDCSSTESTFTSLRPVTTRCWGERLARLTKRTLQSFDTPDLCSTDSASSTPFLEPCCFRVWVCMESCERWNAVGCDDPVKSTHTMCMCMCLRNCLHSTALHAYCNSYYALSTNVTTYCNMVSRWVKPSSA